MTAIRRYVRAVAMTWLLCQATSLAAFVPEQCCVTHAAEAAAKQKAADEACHETPPAEPKEGDACPMHHGTQQRSHECCAMTNACDGPGVQLASLIDRRRPAFARLRRGRPLTADAPDSGTKWAGRHRARAVALQALYECEVGGLTPQQAIGVLVHAGAPEVDDRSLPTTPPTLADERRNGCPRIHV